MLAMLAYTNCIRQMSSLQGAVVCVKQTTFQHAVLCCSGDHEATTRVKTQFMVEMDGCRSKASNAQVVVVAATNRPEVPTHCPHPLLQLFMQILCLLCRVFVVDWRAVQFIDTGETSIQELDTKAIFGPLQLV